MIELKPCPFCGGEASVIGKPHEAKFCVGCGDDSCLGFSGLGWLYDTEDEAHAAWNRREERTCRNVEPENEENNWNELGFFTCSECGSTSKLDWAWHKDVDEYRYCPHCGAKVVE